MKHEPQPNSVSGETKEGFCYDINGYTFVKFDKEKNTAYFVANPTVQFITITIGYTTE